MLAVTDEVVVVSLISTRQAISPDVIGMGDRVVTPFHLISLNVTQFEGNFTNLTPWNQRLWVEAALFRPQAGGVEFEEPNLVYNQRYTVRAYGSEDDVRVVCCFASIGLCAIRFLR